MCVHDYILPCTAVVNRNFQVSKQSLYFKKYNLHFVWGGGAGGGCVGAPVASCEKIHPDVCVLCCVVWCCGVVWCGVVWCGVVLWCGVVCYGVVWCGVVLWCGVVCYGVVWCGVVWCGVVWSGLVWCVCVCQTVCHYNASLCYALMSSWLRCMQL